ncbi:MAG: hypothetical protein ACYTE3_09805 [Planctomycetota bacterium]|jgi:hypothetical protein
MRSPDDIERLIVETRIRPRSEMRGKVLPDALRTQEELNVRKKAGVSFSTWRVLVRGRTTKFAAAAVVICTVLFGVSQFGGASVAWAQVVKNVEQAKVITFRLTTSMTGLPGSEIMVYDSSEYGSRMDVGVEGKIAARIYSPRDKNVSIMVHPEAKTYTRMSFTETQNQQMRQREKSPREFVKLFLSADHTELARTTIAGIEVQGLEVNSPKVGGGMFESAVGRLWVDVKTELPVQMEIEGLSAGGTIQTKIIMDTFRWDERVNASDFEPNIPSDYILLAETKTRDVNEDEMVEGLRFFADLTGGRYPSSMASMTTDQELREAWQQEYSRPPTNEELEKSQSVNAACRFYADLVQEDRGVEYNGNEVTANDIDDELMRWKVSDNEFRVIYGDLRVETVVDRDKLLDTALEISGAKLPPDKRGMVGRMLSLNEKDLVKGLGVFVDLSEGRYPSKLDAKTTIQESDGLGKNRKMSKDERKAKAQDIFFASAYHDKLVREKKDVAYYGDKITIEDPDKVLMRWKLSKDKYRVIFGNLTRKSVTVEKLVEFEKLLSK